MSDEMPTPMVAMADGTRAEQQRIAALQAAVLVTDSHHAALRAAQDFYEFIRLGNRRKKSA